MRPREMMICGGIMGFLMAAASFVFGAPTVITGAFAAGALFGKGYGVNEERERRAALREQKDASQEARDA